MIAAGFNRKVLNDWLRCEDFDHQDKPNHFGSCMVGFSGYSSAAFTFDDRLKQLMEPHLAKARKTRDAGIEDERLTNKEARDAVQRALQKDQSCLFYKWIQEQGLSRVFCFIIFITIFFSIHSFFIL